MNITPRPVPPLALPACAAAVLLLAGCIAKPAATLVAHEKIVTQNFRWVYVTGSHIPIAVPIDPNTRALPSISPLTVLTPDEIRRTGGPLR